MQAKRESLLKYCIVIGTKYCYIDDPVLGRRSPFGVPLNKDSIKNCQILNVSNNGFGEKWVKNLCLVATLIKTCSDGHLSSMLSKQFSLLNQSLC